MKRAFFRFFFLTLLLPAITPAPFEAAEIQPPAATGVQPAAVPMTPLEEVLLGPSKAVPAATCEPVTCQQECAAGCGCPGAQGTCGSGSFGSLCICRCPQCAIVPFPWEENPGG